MTGASAPRPILCHPAEPRDRLIEILQQTLRELVSFDPTVNIIRPSESSLHPRIAHRIRHDVLFEVYQNDYHTDCLDDKRIVERISRGSEKLWFWGDAGEIAAVRRCFAEQCEAPPRLALGTVTVLPAEGIAGRGTGEICRSGSLDARLGARGAGVERIVDFMSGAAWGEDYASLMLTARNRASAPGVRGGEAVHRLHSHYVRSRFWGFAPWYVMQGGCLELLDLRECERDPNQTLSGFRVSPDWWVPGADEADFIEAVCRLNYGIRPRIRWAAPGGACEFRVRIGDKLPDDIQPFNCAYMIADADGEIEFAHGLRLLSDRNPCSIVVGVPLDDPCSSTMQRALKSRGFELYGMLPPRTAGIHSRRPIGYWCRLRGDLQVAAPFYLGRTDGNSDESRILNRARYLLGSSRPVLQSSMR
jgi:hypothetical protein